MSVALTPGWWWEVDEEKKNIYIYIYIYNQIQTIIFDFNCWRGADSRESCESVSPMLK